MNSAVVKETSEKQTVKFGEICREVKLTTKDPLADGYDRYIGLEHLDSGSLKIKRWGSVAEDEPSFTKVFKKGQLLFGRRRAYLKKAAVAEFDGICSGDIIVMEPKGNRLSSEILPFVIQSNSFCDWAIKNSAGGLSPRTKFKSLSEFSITLPDKDKQKEIVRFISDFKRVSKEVESVVNDSPELVEVLIRNFLRYGIIDGREMYDSESWGRLPKEWSLRRLDELSSGKGGAIRTGPYGSSLKGEHWKKSGCPVITIGCLGEYGYDDCQELYIDNGYADTLTAYKVDSGDIVFSRVADIGRAIIVDNDVKGAVISSNLMKISLDTKSVIPHFVYYSIKYSPIIHHQIRRYTNAGGRLLVTSTDLRKVLFPLPSLEEQVLIVKMISMLNSYLESMAVKNKGFENILYGYVSSVLKLG